MSLIARAIGLISSVDIIVCCAPLATPYLPLCTFRKPSRPLLHVRALAERFSQYASAGGLSSRKRCGHLERYEYYNSSRNEHRRPHYSKFRVFPQQYNKCTSTSWRAGKNCATDACVDVKRPGVRRLVCRIRTHLPRVGTTSWPRQFS